MPRLHKPKAGFWIRFAVVVLYPLDGLLFKIRWRRLDKVPPTGGLILVVNHLSYIDTILMARLVWSSGRIPRFMIKSGIFEKPGLGRIMRGAAQIPVYRGTTDAQQSLRDAKKALDAGECIVIYAEGTITRDPDWWPMQAKTGVARLALLAPDAPVVPIGQWGPQFCFDSKSRPVTVRPFPRKTSLAAVGDPVDLSRYYGREPDAEVLREMTDEIMVAVRDLVAELREEPAPAEFFVPPPRVRKPESPSGREHEVISVELARRLRQAGLRWDPAPGDRFIVLEAEMGSEVFVVSDMTVEVQRFPYGTVMGFNGTTEWALDSVEQHRALWLPRETQLRELLAGTFRTLSRDANNSWVVRLRIGAVDHTTSADDAEQAYALALLQLMAAAGTEDHAAP